MDDSNSPLKLKAVQKRKRISTDLSLCIICQTPSEESLLAATDDGKASLWNAACVRKDVVYKTICGEFGASFLESKRIILYHKKCIGPYNSPRNLQPMIEECTLTKEKNEKKGQALSVEIEWALCIICQRQSRKKVTHTHLLSKEIKAQELLNAALNTDKYVALQNITVDDLIKRKVVYHASCMQAIIHDSEKSKNPNANDETDHDKAFKIFVDEISEELFDNHQVFTLAELLTTYKLHLPKDKALSYTS